MTHCRTVVEIARQGVMGPPGPVGPEGPSGPIGATGPQGDTGPIGETGPQGETGPAGADGTDGDNGWSPILAVVTDGERRVLQVIDWDGGEGTPPASGLYVGASGLVVNIVDAVNIRGAAGVGSGDMLASVYDPQGINDDAFDRANHTGIQALSTISGVSTFAGTYLDETTADATLDVLGDTLLRAIAGLATSAGSYLAGTGTGATSAALRSIVGTVSQSGGVPTGALFQHVSNANGDYVRFADGTQVCWIVALAVSFVNANRVAATWTFPASFASAPATFASIQALGTLSGTDLTGFPSAEGATTTGVSLAMFGNGVFASGDTAAMNGFAIGRWF